MQLSLKKYVLLQLKENTSKFIKGKRNDLCCLWYMVASNDKYQVSRSLNLKYPLFLF